MYHILALKVLQSNFLLVFSFSQLSVCLLKWDNSGAKNEKSRLVF